MRIKIIFATALALVLCLSACQSKPHPLSKEEVNELTKTAGGLVEGQTTAFPVLNIYIDNPVIGDENNFIRMAPWNDDGHIDVTEFQAEDFTIEPGQSYVAFVYYHNAADPSIGEAGLVQYPILVIKSPEIVRSGKDNFLYATFAYDNDAFCMAMDHLTLVADTDVCLQPEAMASGEDGTLYYGIACDNDCQKWIARNPVVRCTEGENNYIFMTDSIASGYDNAGYIFIKLKAVAAE